MDKTNFLFFFTTLSILYINIATKKKLPFILAPIPPIALASLGLFSKLLSMAHIDFKIGLVEYMSNTSLPGLSSVTALHVTVEILIYILLIILTIIGIIGVFDSKKDVKNTALSSKISTPQIITVLLFIAAFCSRILTGFSPTVYASYYRTAIVECILIALVNGFILSEYNKKNLGPKSKVFKIILNLVAVLLGIITVVKPMI